MSRAKRAVATKIAVSLALPRILIVDDDKAFLDGARDYFASCGFDVDIALTPDAGKRILEERGKDYYQLIVTDYDFGDEHIKGDAFVRENRHLFGKSKIAIISGAAGLTQQIRTQLREAQDLFLEKSPRLTTKLKDLTQVESAKRANEIETVIKEMAPRIEKLTGEPVDVKFVSGHAPLLQEPLFDVAKRMKQVFLRWLRTRGELDEPVLAYGKNLYSANQLIEHVEDETEVGLAHMRMLLKQFEYYSLEVNGDDSQNHEHEHDAE
jgi:CheY-like chemotaxis protein